MERSYNISDKAIKIAESAQKSILYEVSSYPSPGLVSPVSNGSHNDMDFYMFIDSSTSLLKTLLLCAEAGFNFTDNKELFKHIRAVGVEGEEYMLEITQGVNTHKGMIFLMGICCAAVSNALHRKLDFSGVREIISGMTEGLVATELDRVKSNPNRQITHGEKMFLLYNIKGIREEVEKGMPTVFDYSLKFYEDCMDMRLNDRLVHTLIGIMQFCEDTTIIYRKGIGELERVKNKAGHILSLGGMRTLEGQKAVKALDEEFISTGISPGGSADLLAVTHFLHSVKKDYWQ